MRLTPRGYFIVRGLEVIAMRILFAACAAHTLHCRHAHRQEHA